MVDRASKKTNTEKSQKSTKEFSTFTDSGICDFTDSGICLNLEDFSKLSINPFEKSKISIDWDNISTSTQITNSNFNKSHSQFQIDFTDSGICLPNANIFSENHHKKNLKISYKSFSQSRKIRKK